MKKELDNIKSKYEKIISNNSGKVIKFENWGLMILSYKIKKNKKGHYIHYKIEANENLIKDLEKNERIDNQILRFLSVKVKKFQLDIEYFGEKKFKNAEAKI